MAVVCRHSIKSLVCEVHIHSIPELAEASPCWTPGVNHQDHLLHTMVYCRAKAIASALTCRLAGYLVPYYSLSEETAAPEGLCAGEALIAPPSSLPRRSLRQWLSDLKFEQFLLPSFIFMLIAAVSFVLMLCPGCLTPCRRAAHSCTG